jgi:hypothetical protein
MRVGFRPVGSGVASALLSRCREGRYTIRLKLTGPETTTFRVEFGGNAFTAVQ